MNLEVDEPDDGAAKVVHVLPLEEDHSLCGFGCPCGPRLDELADGSRKVVHRPRCP